MVGVNVLAADTDAEARRQFTSLREAFLILVRGRPSSTRSTGSGPTRSVSASSA
jgi:hypothetical protein